MNTATLENATERVTFLMTPSEKAKLEAKARKAGGSIGEYLRRSVDAYDPEEHEALELLGVFADALIDSNRRAHAALDKALASVDETLAYIRAAHL